nr:TlpA disulfide reductase family protein [Pedobacter panaciterrae]
MKKTILTIVMAVLCLIFTTKTKAQKKTQAIQIGENVPPNAIPSKYKDKLLILDFWATWCSPCITMIPKMEAFQEQFNNQIQIIPVTYQTKEEVHSFLAKLNKDKHSVLPEITDDKELHAFFPHTYLPHYVWIDKTGKVIAITGYEELTETNIQKAIDGNLTVKEKTDVQKTPYNRELPLFINSNGGYVNNMLFHSVLTPYKDDLSPELYTLKKNGKAVKISTLNVPVIRMLRYAYGEDRIYLGANRVILEGKDTLCLTSNSTGSVYGDWIKKNGYAYEIYLSSDLEADIWKLMQKDLARFFPQYNTALEKRITKCLVLVRTSNKDKLKTKGQKYQSNVNVMGCTLRNASLWEFFVRLNVLYMQDSQYPLVNEAGYEGMIDMDLNCNLSNLNAINLALKQYDLAFVTKEVETDMLVIKDNIK